MEDIGTGPGAPVPDDGRRQFIAKTLVAGGIIGAPMIVTMPAASAASLHSPPPRTPQSETVPPAPQQAKQPDPPAVSSSLAMTGANIKPTTAAGLGAVIAGGTLVWVANKP